MSHHHTSSHNEVACVYAALILQDDDVAITGEKIATILKAAHVEVEPFWPGLFAKALDGVDVKKLITDISGGIGVGAAPAASGAPAPAGGGAAAPAAEEKKEEPKKEEKEEESDEDLGFGLFD